MTDLIRREDAIQSLRERFCGDCKPGAKCDVCDTDTLIRDMVEVPPVDAVEIVRCENCYYYAPEDKYKYAGHVGRCRKHNRQFLVWRDGFCSLGVRKEEFIHGSEESESTD